jgi:prophage regulatory protein
MEIKMSHPTKEQPLLLRRKQVEATTGLPCSTLYARINEGLFPSPVNIGARSVGWISTEISQLNGARITGQTDDQIRALVTQLHAARKTSKQEDSK